MATQTDRGRRKGRGEKVKVEVGGGGGGGIIVIGCALIGAAIGAAFVAHRGRGSSNRGRGRKLDQEEKGLQSLLPSADRCGDRREVEASSADISQESASEKSEIRDAIESDEGSEGTGSSSMESGAEVVWPSDVIEQQKEFSSFEVDEMKHISEAPKNHREDEFSFDSTVQIQETTCIDSDIINQIEAGAADTIDDNITVEEFSFWTVKSSMPEIHTEQNSAESEIDRVHEKDKLEPNKDLGEFCIEEKGEKTEKGSEILEASRQLEKTEDVFVSESEDSLRTLQNLHPTTNSTEQQKGHVSVDSSEGTQDIACNDLEMEMEIAGSLNSCKNFEDVVETRENQLTDMNADNNVVEESDISLVEEGKGSSSINSLEEIELQVDNVGENEKEESEGSRSSVEFSDHAVLTEDIIERGKMDDSLSITEMKARESSFNVAEINMLDNETDETLEDSVIAHEEIVKEEEHRDTPVKSLEEEIRSHVEEVNKTGGSIETENSPKEFDGKGIWLTEAAFKELSEDAAWPAKLIEQEEPPSAVTNEMKQEEDISEKMEDIFGSEAEDNTRTLQNLIPSTGSIEQEKGNVLDTSEENQGNSCNGFKKAEMVVEAEEKQSEEADTSEDNGIVQEPYISDEEEMEGGSSVNFHKEIEVPVEDAGEKGKEGPEKSRNSSVKFDDHAVLPADASEQEKMDGSMSIAEMKHQLEIPKDHEETNCSAEGNTKYNDNPVQESLSNGAEFNIPDDEAGVDLEDSKIVHVEAEVVVEQEEKGDDKLEGSSAKSLEEIMSDVEEENERDKSAVTDNPSKEFDPKANKTGIDWDGAEIVHVEEEGQEDEEGDDKQEGSSVKYLEEEIMSDVEEESEREESIGTGNSSIAFDTKGVWPAELVELENGPVPMCEMKQLPENLEKINQMIGVVQDEGDENSTGGIQSFHISNDKRGEISGESAEEIQVNVCMNLDGETEGSQNTCKKSEIAMEIEESQLAPNINRGDDIVIECSYDDSISNISQEQNKQDFEESDTSHESEMAMEIEESQLVPNIDHGDDIVKECSYDDSISNILQQNKQDLEESDTSHES